MRSALAFVRYDFMTAMSYRVNMLLTLGGLVVSVVPLYFVAKALQPVMEESIDAEGGEYFAFVLLGMFAFRLTYAAVNALPEAVSLAIRSGTLECLVATPVSLWSLIHGLMGYRLLWASAEAAVLLIVGVLLGANVFGSQVVLGTAIMVGITLAYVAFGLVGAALMLMFRTTGPLLSIVTGASILLGGVYYPTHVIPSWIQHASAIIPLTYGLRALRQTLLEGLPFDAVRTDFGILIAATACLLAGGISLFSYALRYARRAGTLAQY